MGLLLGMIALVPTSALSGGPPTYTCQISVSAEFNDYGYGQDLTNWNLTFGSCTPTTLLDLAPSYNLFGFTLNLGVTLTDASGQNHCVGCNIGVQIPALETGYPFTASTSVSNVPAGTYALTITSPIPIGSNSGPKTVTQTVSVP
ncbi:MAG: hypothetical protein KGN01_07540 [Patescibacteria group bacterium]|nr:hypothetical protein [Patescibacteria group bacterium]